MLPITIYLDQNKWIQLSRFYYEIDKDEDGRYKNLLQKIFLSVENKKAIFPLSMFHIVETRTEKDMERRKRLFEFMMKVSNGWTIAPPWAVIPKEIEKLINNSSEKQYTVFKKSNSKDQLYTFLFQDENDKEQRRIYYELLGIYAQKIENARKGKTGSPYKKKGLKYLYARNLIITFQEEMFKLANRYNLTPEKIVGLIGMFEKIPVIDTQLELVSERDRDLDRHVDKNDMVDISFFSVAIPYCDIVIAEKYWTTLALRKQLGLKAKYNTEIFRDIILLENYL